MHVTTRSTGRFSRIAALRRRPPAPSVCRRSVLLPWWSCGARYNRAPLGKPRALFIGSAFVLGSTICSPTVVALASEGGEEAISLEYVAPRECLDREGFIERVTAYTRRWRLAREGEPSRAFVLHVERDRDMYRATFELRGADGAERPVVRVVHAPACDDVVSALAVAVVLALDPQPARREAPEEAQEEPAELGPEPPPAPSSAVRRSRAVGSPSPHHEAPVAAPPSVEVALGARGEVNTFVSGVLPSFGGYVELDLALWRPIAWIQPRARLGFLQSLTRTSHEAAPSIVDISWTSAVVELCPARARLSARWSLDPCAGAHAGVLAAHAPNVPDSGTRRRPWFDAGVLLVGRFQPTARLFVEATVGAWVPLRREALRVDPDGVASEPPRVGAAAGLGLGWRF